MGNETSIIIGEGKIRHGAFCTTSRNETLYYVAKDYNKNPHKIWHCHYESKSGKVLITNVDKRVLIINGEEFKKQDFNKVLGKTVGKITTSYQKKCCGKNFFVILEGLPYYSSIKYTPSVTENKSLRSPEKEFKDLTDEEKKQVWKQLHGRYQPTTSFSFNPMQQVPTYTYYDHGAMMIGYRY
jgi:hypothetical protein